MLNVLRQESDIATMRLMLLRHAKTERAEPGARDFDRKLTQRGQADAALIGAHMARKELEPDLAVVSTATRAQQTWALVVAAFAKAPRTINDERIYNASPEKLIGVIAETQAARSLLVVGHNPSLHDLALRLIASGDAAARERLNEGLPTSGLVVIDLPLDDWSRIEPQAGNLECFVTPRLIAGTPE